MLKMSFLGDTHMTMRRLLLSTVIGGGMGLAALPALAAAPQTFQPNTAWAVSMVEARNTGSGAYCTLARRFSGDMILTFARNARDESSLAIDFQKDLLKPSDTYYVTLKPGAGQDRMFEVKPVSGKAMVIRMGQDFAFYDALSRASSLKIDISGQIYEFMMPDMTGGQSELNGCLAALVQPAAGGDGAMAPVAPPSAADMRSGAPVQLAQATPERNARPDLVARDVRAEQILAAPASAPSAETNALAAQVEALRNENLRLKNAMERDRRSYEDRFVQQNADSRSASELVEKVRLLEAENGTLRQSLTAVAAAPKAPPVTNEMMDRVRLLETENEGLRRNLATIAAQPVVTPQPLQCDTGIHAPQTAGIDATLKAELETLRAENGTLKTRMLDQNARMAALEQQASNAMLKAESAVRADNGAAMTQMQQRVAQLEEENAILRTKVKNRHSDAKPGEGIVTLAQLRAAESQLQVVQTDRERLMKQIEDIQKGKGGDLLAKAAGDWNLEEATRRFNEAEREIRRLGGQLQQERAKCAADVKKVEYMMFDPSIATKEQTARLMELEERIMSFDANAAVQSAAYQSRIKTLENTVSAKEKAAQEAQQRLAAIESRMTEKDNAIREGQKKIVMLEQTIASKGTGALETTQKLAMLEKNLAAKDAEIKTLQDALGGMQQKFASLQQDVISKDSQLKVTGEKLAAAQQTIDNLQAVSQTKLAQQQDLGAQQKTQILAVQTQLAELQAQKAQLVAERDQLQQARHNVTRNDEDAITAIKAERDNLRQRVATLQADMQTLETALAQVGPAAGGSAVAAVTTLAAAHPQEERRPSAQRPAQEQRIVPRIDAVQAEPLAAPAGMPVAGAPRVPAVEIPAGAYTLADNQAVERLLQQAGIRPQGGINTESQNAQMVSYSWDTGTVYGSAEQQPLTGLGQFGGMVQAYLDKTGQRCNGEFAAVPGALEEQGGIRMMGYEIACVMPDGAAASAALLFHAQEGIFTTIAHEADIALIDSAMDARDALYKSLAQTRIAAR